MAWIRALFVGTVLLAPFAHGASAQEPANEEPATSAERSLPELPPLFAQVDLSTDSPPAMDDASGTDRTSSLGASNGLGTGLYVGASFYLLKPYFSGNNTAYVTNTSMGTIAPGQTITDFTWDYSASPAGWVGWTSDGGLGVRGRFFYFEQSSQTATTSLTVDQANNGTSVMAPTTIPAPPGAVMFGAPGALLLANLGKDELAFNSSLHLYTADIEATWMGQSGNFSWFVAGGGRFLSMAQSYTATLTNSVSGAAGQASEMQNLARDHNFSGFGPTLNFRGDYRILNTGLSLYGDVRGSLLVGTAGDTTAFSIVVVDPSGIAGGSRQESYAVSGSRETTMPVLEIELGIAYAFGPRRLPMVLSAGAVNQTYFDAGSASQTGGNLSLFGGRFSLLLQF